MLHIKGVPFTEYDVTSDCAKEQEMRRRSQRRTVPEIFVDGVLLGGCSELFELDEEGRLDAILDLNHGG